MEWTFDEDQLEHLKVENKDQIEHLKIKRRSSWAFVENYEDKKMVGHSAASRWSSWLINFVERHLEDQCIYFFSLEL